MNPAALLARLDKIDSTRVMTHGGTTVELGLEDYVLMRELARAGARLGRAPAARSDFEGDAFSAQSSYYDAPNGVSLAKIVDGFGLGFWRAAAIKYLIRAGKKGPETQDLNKALSCIKHELSLVEARQRSEDSP